MDGFILILFSHLKNINGAVQLSLFDPEEVDAFTKRNNSVQKAVLDIKKVR